MEPKRASPTPSSDSLRSDWSKERPPDLGNDEPRYRPASPASSSASLRSDWSKERPPDLGNDEPRPASPASSTVSLRSDWSKEKPPDLGLDETRPSSPAYSDLTVRSDWSKEKPPDLGNEQSRPDSPLSSSASLRSDWSKERPPAFGNDEPRPSSPAYSDLTVRSDWSKDEPPYLGNQESRPDSPLSSSASLRSDWSKERPPAFGNDEPSPSERPVHRPDETLDFRVDGPRQRLRNEGRKRILALYEDSLNNMKENSYLYEIVKKKDTLPEMEPVQFYNYVFRNSNGKTARTVLTKGEAGAGKTFHTMKFMVDWAKGKSNKDIDLIVPLDFKQLNEMSDQEETMENLLNHFLKGIEESGISFHECDLAFVLDGLENCQLPLEFKKNKEVTDVMESAKLDVLLTNLIEGKLLPNARLWITSQPSGVKKIPKKFIGKMMECQENLKPQLIMNAKKKIRAQYANAVLSLEEDSELCEMDGGKVVSLKDIFQRKLVQTVLTEGAAGVGKTFQTRKLMVDWAKGNSNQSIELIIPISLNELKGKTEKVQSMKDLLCHFLDDEKWKGGRDYISECKLAIILDDLEKCESPLDFDNNSDLTDINQPGSVDALLTNLIKGNLLPAARLWIISQPSGTNKIPPDYIDKVTVCRETTKRRKELASKLKVRYRREYPPNEDWNHPNQKNTEHILREQIPEEVTEDGKPDGKTLRKTVTLVTTSDIFKDGKVRVVLTIGETNVGKSFHIQKFIKEWAGDKNLLSKLLSFGKNLFGKAEDVEVIFPFDLSKSEFKLTKVSLMGLLNNLFEETKKYAISDYSKFKLVFLLDGLDAFQTSLDFDDQTILNDIRVPASVGSLLTNLIRGNLLPSARLWITSQPSAVTKLPAKYVDKLTEIREKPFITSKRNLKSQLKRQLTYVPQGTDGGNTSAVLSEIYTDLYIIEGDRGDINKKHEVIQVDDARSVRKETPIEYSNIFKNSSGESHPIKTVLTIGIAGIGKTFASMKYVLDWAESPAGESIDYIFLLPFRELNFRKEHEHSFEDLIHQLFPTMKNSEINNYDKHKILIVLDGLDECRLDLNFNEDIRWTDVTKPTSINVLLTNLIQGNLLPTAQIWITSRPAASNNIPPDKVNRVTEVRGFNDKQKEEYFRKRFIKQELAEAVLSEVKKSRSLFIMCYIPIFCWITSNVMEDILTKQQKDALPKTLTYMYTRFLLQQCEQANVKYGETETSEKPETDSCWNERNKETVLALGKLAFEELEKGNLLFTEELLDKCAISIKHAAVFSGLFTQIKRESCGIYPQELFCFVHLSIHEFLAALYVSHRFTNNGENVFTSSTVDSDSPASDFYKKAVDKALESKNGDWDLFLRFLLGLSLETHQNLLQELLKTPQNNKKMHQETIEYIKQKIREVKDAERNLNLFHCLNELNDDSLLEEVKKSLEKQNFENFSPSQWSALTFVLLTSDANLDVFDLKNYLKSETVLLGMLPVVKVSETTLLSWCDLTEKSCSGLNSSVLSSASSNLTVLDMSHNDLKDEGIHQLAQGLKSIHCKLKTLKLAGCQVREEGCFSLASALKEKKDPHLKDLDLSYNHPGERGVKALSEIFVDPSMKLCVDYAGEHRLKKGIKKFDALLKFDENTIGKRLVLSDNNKKVKTVTSVKEKVARPENEDRFKRTQVLCEEGLEDFGYWEVEWKGSVGIAVSYKEVGRKWDNTGGLGCNDMSWSLRCSDSGFTGRDGKTFTGFIARHGKTSEHIRSQCYQKLAVYLDWKAGTLSYYGVSSGELSLIHTFHAQFKSPLFPGFWFQKGSVTLCDIV